MSDNGQNKLLKKASNAEVDAFLRKVAATPIAKSGADRGRLIFAMDATASRKPTWDTACHIQGQMFQETANLGGLEIQLCYYRGFAEFNAGPWLVDSAALLKRMTLVSCLGGQTQIEKILRHTITETKVNALVFVGDCMEEDADGLCQLAATIPARHELRFVSTCGRSPYTPC